MRLVNLTLDGKPLTAPAGTTLLELARANGVDLPSLCHDPRLAPFGACRLCLVDVEGARRPVPACATTVSEGMVVRTDTEELNRLRRLALELLLSAHYGDCEGPCKRACPAGIDIQGFIALIACGEYAEAIKLIKETMPLPAVCGRVCPRFCEEKCRRNLVDEPVAICDLKRFVADLDLAQNGQAYRPTVKPPTGKKVAVVGGGPAGLSAAWFLAREGHAVTIFEAAPALGGMLRYGIPAYRLPKDVLDREIGLITELCAEVRLNTALGRDFTVADLKAQGFDAIFVGLGAQASQSLRVPGEELAGVIGGVDFLRRVASGERVTVGRRVAVVGGGNTAMDAARTSLRLGAEEVLVLYRRSRQEMPARAEEIEEAEEEGVIFHFLTNPVRLLGEGGRLVAAECQKMALGEPDSSGRRRPQPVPGSEFSLPVDTLILAIGQTLDRTSLTGSPELDGGGYLKADPETGATAVPGVFAGGDCVSGPATVVEAVAAGRKAAMAINSFLTHGRVLAVPKPFNASKGELKEIDPSEYADRPRLPRTQKEVLPAEERKRDFREYTRGFTEQMAQGEAARCLSCGCQDVFTCELRRLATAYGVTEERLGRGRLRYRPQDDHRYILRDPNKCIVCGSCVRICSELHGVGALGFAFRGYDTLVQPSLGLPLAETLCDSCGQCVSACPTGALSARVFLPKPGPWETRAVPSICPHCGVGCQLELHVVGNKLVRVSSPIGNPVNDGNLCKNGAFGHAWMYERQRPSRPLVQKEGRLEETTWEEALRAAAKTLGEIRSYLGPERLAVLVSPRLSLEENYLAQKLARLGLETNNIASLGGALPETLSSATYADLAHADLILVVGTDLPVQYPVIGQKLRQFVERGANLALINTRSTRLDALARLTIEVNQRRIRPLVQAMLKYLLDYDLFDELSRQQYASRLARLREELAPYTLDRAEDALRVKPAKVIDLLYLYLRAKNPVIITDAGLGAAEVALLADLALLCGNSGRPGSGLLVLQPHANGAGQRLAGVAPHLLTGARPVTDAAARQKHAGLWGKELPEGRNTSLPETVDGLVVLAGGEELELGSLFPKQPFTVLLTPVLTNGLTKANIILPGAGFAETAGTFVNAEGRWQELRPALVAPGGKQNWEIIAALLGALGQPQSYAGPEAVRAEILALMEEEEVGLSLAQK